jgi:type VI protein secretion system component Hcp
MANDAGDVLMMVVGSDGKGVPAECQTELATGKDKDDMMDGFVKGTYFELEDFDFGMNVEDRDDESTADNQTDTKKTDKKSGKGKAKFQRWMSMPIGAKASIDSDGGYPVDLEPFSFTRHMDKASPLFFNAISSKLSFKSATVVKRKDVGAETGPQAFLRIDFTDVLFISIGWDNGEIVKEKCKFICRQVLVKYRPQAHSGLLGPVVSGAWSRKMETKA